MRRVTSVWVLLAWGVVFGAVVCACERTEPREPLPPLRDGLNFLDVEGSRLRFQRIALRAQRRGDLVYAAEAHTQEARCVGLLGRRAEAGAMLDRVPSQPGGDHPRVRLRILLERGRLLNLEGRSAEALPFFLEAWQSGVELREHELALDAAHMVANASPPSEAEAWNRRAIEYAQESGDVRLRDWLAPLHHNLGWIHYQAGRFPEALRDFESARQAYARMGDHRSDELLCEHGRAKSLRGLGRVEEALALEETVRAGLLAEGWKVGDVHEELAEIYTALGRQEDARAAAGLALELLAKDPKARDDARRLARLRALAAR